MSFRFIPLLFPVVLLLAGTVTRGHAANLSLADLGVSSYDSDYVGFGIVVADADLGGLDPSLAGISVTVSTSSPLDPSQARAWSSTLQPNPAVSRGPVTWTFQFSQPVTGEWRAQSQTFTSGETTTVTGGGPVVPQGGWQPGLLTRADTVSNPTGTAISQDFRTAEAVSDRWTFSHDDRIGSFGGQVMQLNILHAPEPSRLLLLATALLLLGFRRRRQGKAGTQWR